MSFWKSQKNVIKKLFWNFTISSIFHGFRLDFIIPTNIQFINKQYQQTFCRTNYAKL